MSEVEREAGRYRKGIGASFLFTFVWIWTGGRAAGGKNPGDGISGGRKLRSTQRSVQEKAERRASEHTMLDHPQ